MWKLVPQPGIEPGPLALGVQSLSHWTTRGVPYFHIFMVTEIWFSFSRLSWNITSSRKPSLPPQATLCLLSLHQDPGYYQEPLHISQLPGMSSLVLLCILQTHYFHRSSRGLLDIPSCLAHLWPILQAFFTLVRSDGSSSPSLSLFVTNPCLFYTHPNTLPSLSSPGRETSPHSKAN